MTRARHKIPMPDGLAPRGVPHDQAAVYVGFSPSKFDELVEKNLMPSPKVIAGVQVWDVRALDKAFDALPTKGAENDNWRFEA